MVQIKMEENEISKERFYEILNVLCENSSDHKLYLHISSISKDAKQIAHQKFTSFDFSHTKVNDDFLSLL